MIVEESFKCDGCEKFIEKGKGKRYEEGRVGEKGELISEKVTLLCMDCVVIRETATVLEAGSTFGTVVARVLNTEIKVCQNCRRASCWQGVFMCEQYQKADTVYVTVKELLKEEKEDPSFWKTDLELIKG